MANNAPSPKLRPPANLLRLNRSPRTGRFAVVNHFNQTRARLAETARFPSLSAFLPQNLWPWISSYLKYVFTPRFPFPSYSGPNTGIYRLQPAIGTRFTLAVAGDWGTGTQEAETVTNLMATANPELTVHLGDVYYVGDDREIEENCLGKPNGGFSGVVWRHGSQGSFALNGNHEMYANGTAYFTRFLPTLGVNSDPGQLASFFCLEIGAWRILAIDTGYNSVGIPILSLIPGLNSLFDVGGDCRLEKALLDWLKKTVHPQTDPKPTLILSHHEYFSAFKDKDYTRPAKQLRRFFGAQEVVWVWGHEHRLAIYEKYAKDGGVKAYGRCAGHGGMPVELDTPDTAKAPIEFYDTRSHLLDGAVPVGKNGFVLIHVDGNALTLDYRDIDNAQLLVETFTPGARGALNRTFEDPGILTRA